MNNSYALLPKINKKHAIKALLDDYYFDYWKITYKNDKLGEMSTGKASFVILMLIIGLSKSKSPILIDQPEDNLDNMSITRDLVYYLKNKKLERQIIVVTTMLTLLLIRMPKMLLLLIKKDKIIPNLLVNFNLTILMGLLKTLLL